MAAKPPVTLSHISISYKLYTSLVFLAPLHNNKTTAHLLLQTTLQATLTYSYHHVTSSSEYIQNTYGTIYIKLQSVQIIFQVHAA